MSKKSKIILGIFALFLPVMLFAAFLEKLNRGIAGLIVPVILGILIIIFSVSLSRDLKKLDKSMSFKILTILLVNIVSYVALWFFWVMCYYWIFSSVMGYPQDDFGIGGVIMAFIYAFLGVLSFMLGFWELLKQK